MDKKKNNTITSILAAMMAVLAACTLCLLAACNQVPIPLSLSVDASDAKTEYVEGGTLDVSIRP